MGAQTLTFSEASDRLARTKAWDSDVSRLRYASGSRAEVLQHMGLVCVRDLLLHIPHRYLDFTNLQTIGWAQIGHEATIVGTIDRINLKHPKPKLSLVEVSLIDNTGVLACTFFKQPWLANQLHKGDTLAVSGKIEFSYGFKRMVPQFHEVVAKASDKSESQQIAQFARILPVHPLSEGISAAWMRRIESSAIANYGDVCDFLPAALCAELHLMSEARALREIHFPTSLASAERARRRLAFDELICLQLALLSRRTIELAGTTPHSHCVNGPYLQALLAALPFELTVEQNNALQEILQDMKSPVPMNRLLLGDVGTGKTAVAALALAAVADSKSQAAMMAPTSVLAAQYAQKLGPLFDDIGVSWALVTGSTPAQERSQVSERLSSGELTVLFGTTALLAEDFDFKNLSLVVIDEQHRFGVHQRAALRSKGRGADQLVMSATPIPRTMALSLYGDMKTSNIATRPHPGAGLTTKLLTPENVDLAHSAIAEALSKGQQAYVVCPIVEESDDELELDDVPESERTQAPLHALSSVYERLSTRVFPQAKIAMLHGRMRPEEKDATMQAFRAGDIQILVCTTVIEVGVDVPNATVMMIWNADRFGLATLHQLRGRVGRGTFPGMVYLVSAARTKSRAAKRLSALEQSSNGLELAQMDLQLRHEGDILGLRQSGGVTLHMVDMVSDLDLIEAAHRLSADVISKDPALTQANYRPLAQEVRRRFDTFFEAERNR